MESMRLNNIERVLNYSRSDGHFPSVFNVDANYAGSLIKLKKKTLFELLEGQGIYRTSRTAIVGIQYGFNDYQVMGEIAESEKRKGNSQLWIGLDRHVVNLEIHPKILDALGNKDEFDYAKSVLETVVCFVENHTNYRR